MGKYYVRKKEGLQHQEKFYKMSARWNPWMCVGRVQRKVIWIQCCVIEIYVKKQGKHKILILGDNDTRTLAGRLRDILTDKLRL